MAENDGHSVDGPKASNGYRRLQDNLNAASRLTVRSVSASMGIALGIVAAIFIFNVTGPTFFLLAPLAPTLGSLPAVFATYRLRRYSGVWRELEELIHQEWIGSQDVLPSWFKIPRLYKQLRRVPPMSEAMLRRLRFARLALSRSFMVVVMVSILANAFVGMVLAFNHVRGPILAAQQLVVVLPILTFYGLVGPATGILRGLREYERVTGRTVLPPDLSSAGGTWRPRQS